MASNDIVSAILHYKRNIDKISAPPERALKYEDRLLHCINKLYKLPVNVNHLQETGVGRTVNSLRKIEGEKGLGDAAKALVSKWKTMVMLEDEAERKQKEELSGPSEEEIKRIRIIRDAEEKKKDQDQSKTNKSGGHSGPNKTEKYNGFSPKSPDLYCPEKTKIKSKENDKKRKNESLECESTIKKSKYEYTPKEKHYSKYSRKTDSDESGNSASDNEKYNPEHVTSQDMKSASKLLSNLKNFEKKSSPGTSSAQKDHEPSKSDHKKSSSSSSSSKHHSSSKSSSKSSSSKQKSSSSNHDKSESGKYASDKNDEGIDCQSGASFADALGPIIMKKSPKKKSANSTSSSIPTSDSTNKEKKLKKEEKKDLLFPPADLVPLEPDLISTLATPTPHYKPNPTYNLPMQEVNKKRAQAEEDALFTMMSNKNQRTKVYSGVKGGLTYVPTLYECCCRVLQQHIDALEYTGGIPYALLKPVLLVATPAQLYQFEHFNPYVIEDTDELWKTHVNREFRSEQRQEYESWRDMYLRCVDEREEKYKAVKANIQKSIEKSVPVRKAKLAYIDVAKPPRNIIRKQIKNGTAKPESARLLGKNDPEAVKVAAPKQPTTKEPAVFKIKPKVAPLMQKTLKSIKMTRFKR